MAVETVITELRFNAIVAGVPIGVDIRTYKEEHVVVYYGNSRGLATRGVDYNIDLDPADYDVFTFTPLTALINKINALIATFPSEINTVLVRRVVPLTSDFQETDSFIRRKIVNETDLIAMRIQQLATQGDQTQGKVDGFAYDINAIHADRLAADASATVAAAAASALGNAIHVYETRAQAAATAIPVGTQSITVKRFDVGYPLAPATYIPGAGPLSFIDDGGAGHLWHLDVSSRIINSHWYGAKVNGDYLTHAGQNDLPALNAAYADCVTYDCMLTLAGNYVIETTWVLNNKVRVEAVGPTNLLNRSATPGATAVSLTHAGTYRVFFGYYGNVITIKGNANTGTLIETGGQHESRIRANLVDCTDTAGHVLFHVDSDIDLRFDGNSNAITIGPSNGIVVDERGAGTGEISTLSRFHFVATGVNGTGVLLNAANNCKVAGTSEGNQGSGLVELGGKCTENELDMFFCESNCRSIAGYDFYIAGNRTTLNKCSSSSLDGVIGGSTLHAIRTLALAGTSPFIWGGYHRYIQIGMTVRNTILLNVSYGDPVEAGGGFEDFGTNTTQLGLIKEGVAAVLIPNKMPLNNLTPLSSPALLNGWVNSIGVGDVVGYYRNFFNRVFVRGLIRSGTVGQPAFVLPLTCAPLAPLHFVQCNPVAGTVSIIKVDTDGTVTPLFGTNTGLSLNFDFLTGA